MDIRYFTQNIKDYKSTWGGLLAKPGCNDYCYLAGGPLALISLTFSAIKAIWRQPDKANEIPETPERPQILKKAQSAIRVGQVSRLLCALLGTGMWSALLYGAVVVIMSGASIASFGTLPLIIAGACLATGIIVALAHSGVWSLLLPKVQKDPNAEEDSKDDWDVSICEDYTDCIEKADLYYPGEHSGEVLIEEAHN